MIELESIIERARPNLIAVAFHDRQTGEKIFIHADESIHPASTFKVGVMMEAYRRAARGEFSLDDEIPVFNSFTSIADGLSFSVSPEDDADTTLYQKIGGTECIREFIRLMIVRSSNLATDILIEKIGAANVTAYLKELGVEGVQVLRGAEDNRAYARGLNNAASARGLMQMLEVILEEKVASPQACAEMIEVMQGQEFNEGIPARLPKTIKVAHKTGWNDRIYHDFGIVFPETRQPYILAVMTRGFTDESEAHAYVAEISERVYNQLP